MEKFNIAARSGCIDTMVAWLALFRLENSCGLGQE
jgi:hypothetical protein